MKQFYSIILLTLLLTGCHDRSVSFIMDNVDSLLVKESNDSAYNIIQSLQEENIKRPEDKAHYRFLKFKTAYLIKKTSPSDSLIDSALVYYQQHKRVDLLAECYYYKAVGLHRKKDFHNSILFYKKAEELSKSSDNPSFNFKISEAMSYVNYICGNYNLALRYAKQTLWYAEKAKKNDWLAHAYYRLGTTYLALGKEDSSLYFFDKTAPYIRCIKEADRPFFLTNLSLVYVDNHPQKAKKLLQQSLKYKELSSTLEQLAFIYYDEGNQEEAYRLWKKALTINDLTPKDNIIHNLLEYDIEHGKTDEVCDQVNEIIAIKDSIINKVKNDTIKDLQIRFDHQVEMNAAYERLIYWQWVLGGFVLLVICLVGYIIWRKHKARVMQMKYKVQIREFCHKILEQEIIITKAEKHILELKSTNSQNQAEIESLEQTKEKALQEMEEMNREMKQWSGREADKIRKGVTLYDDVVKNKIAQAWTPDDYEAFIKYYEIGHYSTVKKIRRENPGITQRNMLYLILIEMKKTREEICHIMSLDKSSIRSIKFRLNSKKNDD